MTDATYDFLIDLLAAQDDPSMDGPAMEPHLVELILDRRDQTTAPKSDADARR